MQWSWNCKAVSVRVARCVDDVRVNYNVGFGHQRIRKKVRFRKLGQTSFLRGAKTRVVQIAHTPQVPKTRLAVVKRGRVSGWVHPFRRKRKRQSLFQTHSTP